MRHFIGLDTHSRTSTFVVLNSKGEETSHQKIQTSEKNLIRMVRSHKGKKALVFEEMFLSKWLYGILEKEVDELIVCNPTMIPKRKGPKNDYADAKHLAQLLRGGFLESVFHKTHEFSEFRSVISGYNSLVKDIVRLKNRYKGIFQSKGFSTPGFNFNRKIDELDKIEDPGTYFVAQQCREMIEEAEAKKEAYKRVLKQNTYRHPSILALTTIPGISFVRANTIAARVVTANRFPNKNKFWSYCMLVKHDKNSDGVSYGKERGYGRSDLKAAFLGAAESVIVNGKQTELYKYYESQIEKGIVPRTAKRNLARKIAGISLAVFRTGKGFDMSRIAPKSMNVLDPCSKSEMIGNKSANFWGTNDT